MSSRIRRLLVLTAVLALSLGASGAVAPAGLAANPTNTKVAGINVDQTTIPQLEALMTSHRINAIELTNFYLRRIHQFNPLLHAVITVSPTARADAVAADHARRSGDNRPLLGIPIIVKDNIDTTGMPTTAGSWALAGSTPDDAFIVQQLKAAGAIIIGKANLSEWANFRSNPSSSGWSGIGGQVNMPYVLDRNPCGSSSGSGVVAAADLAVAAVGTETDGSIVCPSGANGDVGIKPTLGLWSRAGVVPISADQDTAGPIARNVTDAAVLLGAATGVDPDDLATGDQAGHAFTDYTQFLNDHALQGKTIGIWSDGTYDPGTTGPVVEPILANVKSALEAQGATVVDNTNLVFPPNYAEGQALDCEFKTDIATYLQTYVHGTNPVSGAPYPQTRTSRGRGTMRSSRRPRRRTDATPPATRSGRKRPRRCKPISTASWPRTTSTRSSRSPTGRPGRRTTTRVRATSTATSSTSWARRRLARRRATPTSPCPPPTTKDCRSGSPSSAAAGPSRS
jgi:amidase